jgi:metal-sulfur cluster biosynthetic enzyme
MASKIELLDALKRVYDPEIGMNIVDLGMVYRLDLEAETGKVHVDLALTTPGCPLGPEIIRDIKRELRAFECVQEVTVDLVWQPLWHPSMMSDYAKDALGYDEELGLGLGSV